MARLKSQFRLLRFQNSSHYLDFFSMIYSKQRANIELPKHTHIIGHKTPVTSIILIVDEKKDEINFCKKQKYIARNNAEYMSLEDILGDYVALDGYAALNKVVDLKYGTAVLASDADVKKELQL